MKIELTTEAKKTLKKLDSQTKSRILKYLVGIEQLEDPRSRGKGLTDTLSGYWRYRVGDYRLICEIHDEIITILVLKIGHRREIYKL